MAAIVWPVAVFDHPSEEAERAALYGAAFAVYFGPAFVTTFFDTCVVYSARARFHGEDATLRAALGFTLSKAGKIAAEPPPGYEGDLLTAAIGSRRPADSL